MQLNPYMVMMLLMMLQKTNIMKHCKTKSKKNHISFMVFHQLKN